MSTAAKVYNKLLLNRLSPHIEPILRTNQNGFRKGRSTTGHILTLRRIFEEIKEMNLLALFTFIDFRKAFDTVKRQKMFKILEAYGVPDEFIQAIAARYETQAQVITADGESEVFPVSSGVLQGDTLAPYLFIITLDYALRLATSDHEDLGLTIATRRSARHPAKYMTDADYADDIVLMSDTLQDAQTLLHRVEEAALDVGLSINTEKTKAILIGQEDQNLYTLDGNNIETVEDFQ